MDEIRSRLDELGVRYEKLDDLGEGERITVFTGLMGHNAIVSESDGRLLCRFKPYSEASLYMTPEMVLRVCLGVELRG